MGNTRLMAQGHRHMAAGGHPLATQASLSILEAGGNAVDAAVAGAMVLGVVQSDLVNFAGVAPIMIRDPNTTEVTTISGVGRWPRAADINILINIHGGHIPEGILRSIIPAAPDAFLTALEHFGTMSFGEVAVGAIKAADDGFIMHELMAQTIIENEEKYRRWPSNEAIYLPGGYPPTVGQNFVQKDLARTLKYMVDQEKVAKGSRRFGLQAARNAFYKGDIAVAISDYHSQNGGWITMKDMADFNVTIEPPIKVERQGVTLYTCGPWCQGFSLAQMWAFIRDINLKELRHNSAEYIHILTEIIKLVLVDREVYLGDPEFVEIPTAELLSGNYASSRTSLITNDYIIPEEILWKGPRETIETSIISQDTSYMCAIDSNGLSASITPSDGSANTPVTPGWGINPSSRGSQSWAENGHPSCVAPWKRPRLTPNPAIAILKNGSVMPFGTPGADVQTQAMLQVLLNISEFQIPPQKAVELPRFASYDAPDSFEPHTAFRNLLKVENDIDEITVRLLREKGHVVETWPSQNWKAGAVCAIIDEPRKRLLRGAADPRRPCLAMGR